MMKPGRLFLAITCLLLASSLAWAQQRRKVIINQDGSGPGGSNMQTIALLIQSPQVEVLGITVVSGNQWRDEEVAHTLRLLEIMGRTDIPVVPGAVFPLVRRREETQMWQQRFGKVAFAGAWDDRWWHEPFVVPTAAGRPAHDQARRRRRRSFPDSQGARSIPHQVTIYEGGPMTNLALAISIDPQFPELAQQLVFMGGSLGPQTDDPEFVNNPRHEFNFWFDPEAAQIVLARTVEEDRLHPDRHFHQDAPDPRHDQADRRQWNPAGTLRRPLLPDGPGWRVHVGRTCRRGLD